MKRKRVIMDEVASALAKRVSITLKNVTLNDNFFWIEFLKIYA